MSLARTRFLSSKGTLCVLDFDEGCTCRGITGRAVFVPRFLGPRSEATPPGPGTRRPSATLRFPRLRRTHTRGTPPTSASFKQRNCPWGHGVILHSLSKADRPGQSRGGEQGRKAAARWESGLCEGGGRAALGRSRGTFSAKSDALFCCPGPRAPPLLPGRMRGRSCDLRCSIRGAGWRA